MSDILKSTKQQILSLMEKETGSPIGPDAAALLQVLLDMNIISPVAFAMAKLRSEKNNGS